MNIRLDEKQYWIIWHSLILEEDLYKKKIRECLFNIRYSDYEWIKELNERVLVEYEEKLELIRDTQESINLNAENSNPEWFKVDKKDTDEEMY